jgi:hypothetical protein
MIIDGRGNIPQADRDRWDDKMSNQGNLGATKTLDLSTSRNFKGVLNANLTLTLANGEEGILYLIRLTQDGTGNRTVAFANTVVTFPTGEMIQATANKHTLLTLYCLGGNAFLGSYKSGW